MSFVSFRRLETLAKTRKTSDKHNVRSEILSLCASIGTLSSCLLQEAPLDTDDASSSSSSDTETLPSSSSSTSSSTSTTTSPSAVLDNKWIPSHSTQVSMARVLWRLCVASSAGRLDLRSCILNKMKLNERKYPVELCKGKSGKYTQYSHQTGITKTEGQSTMEEENSPPTDNDDDDDNTAVQHVVQIIHKFATEREWTRFHTPRNLILAMIGELGELAELYQWKRDNNNNNNNNHDMTPEELDKVGQELADVSIYLLRLSDVCTVDIGKIALEIAVSEQELAAQEPQD